MGKEATYKLHEERRHLNKLSILRLIIIEDQIITYRGLSCGFELHTAMKLSVGDFFFFLPFEN